MQSSSMAMNSQDVLVLLRLVALNGEPWTYDGLATELDLSPSQVHAAVRRASESGLARIKGIAPNAMVVTRLRVDRKFIGFPRNCIVRHESF